MPRWLGYAAMATGLLPLVAVALRPRAPSAWWWLAGAFAVSFAADLAGLAGYGFVASQTYPLLQASLFALVLAPRALAGAVIAGLAAVSGASLALRGALGLDVALHLAAWGATVGLARWALQPGALRVTLVWGFALLAVAWVGFTLEPTFWAWGAMQAVRLATALGFCYAVSREGR